MCPLILRSPYSNMPRFETLHQWHARALERGTKQASLFAVGIPFTMIGSIVVVARVFVRVNMLQIPLDVDDCRCCAAELNQR